MKLYLGIVSAVVAILVGFFTLLDRITSNNSITIDPSLQLTVYVHGPQSQQEVILENSGSLIVDFGNDRRKAHIGEYGRTNFGEIPDKFKDIETGIFLEAPGFKMKHPDQKITFTGEPIYLEIIKPPVQSGRIELRKNIHDWGLLKRGVSLEHFLSVRNVGRQPVKIQKIYSSDKDALKIDPGWSENLKPGQSTLVKISLNSTKLRGMFSGQVIILSDASNSKIKFGITAIIEDELFVLKCPLGHPGLLVSVKDDLNKLITQTTTEDGWLQMELPALMIGSDVKFTLSMNDITTDLKVRLGRANCPRVPINFLNQIIGIN